MAAPILPTGGTVAAGTASIGAPASSTLTVTQSSAKGIVDWGAFSIGLGGTVRFDNGSGATLNRVTGSGLSAIDGLLSASGSVYLLNPNGVVIGKTGVVDVGGKFVASTLGLSNAQFLTGGDLTFSGGSTASVVNLGKIGALGGDVALIATTVGNAGEISAPQGDVGLLAGSQVLVRDAALDGGKFAVQVGGAGTSTTNSGTIAAAMAELRANGGDVYALAGDTAGVIRATGTATTDGKIFLIAEGGGLSVAGALHAENADGSGGAIETSGGKVAIGGADVSTGRGGSWLVDPVDLTVDATAASTISRSLATTNVTLQTTANTAAGPGVQTPNGSGDITVGAPISWAGANGLTLSAYRNIDVYANLTSTGGGALALTSDNTGTGTGTVSFGAGSKVSTSGAVKIYYNPVSYTDTATYSTRAFNPYAQFVTGGATLTAYMWVNTLAQLQSLNNELDGVYAQSRDIEASSTITSGLSYGIRFDITGHTGFAPIGGTSRYLLPGQPLGPTAFTGTFNGLGHAITNLHIAPVTGVTGGVSNIVPVDYAGLFGYVGASGIITGVRLINGDVEGGAYVGALVGRLDAGATVTNVFSTSGAYGSAYVGGLVGSNAGAISSAEVISSVGASGDYVGGLVGYNAASGTISNATSGTISNGPTRGFISGGNLVGGLVGQNDGQIVNAYSVNSVSGNNDVGGLVGLNYGLLPSGASTASIVGSAATATVSGSTAIGGLVGQNAGLVSGSTTTSTVNGQSLVGGLVGFNMTSGVLNAGANGQGPYAGSQVTGYNVVGGLVGQNDGSIVGGFASGAVSGGNDVGGLVGLNYGLLPSGVSTASIANSSSQGAVNGTLSAVGGLVGQNAGLISGGMSLSNVSGNALVGGLIGWNMSSGVVTISLMVPTTYARGYAAGVNVVGGFAGQNDGVINGASASGTVRGGNDVGGLVGLNYGLQGGGASTASISSSSAQGMVIGTLSAAGGLVGQNAGLISASHSSSMVTGNALVGGLVGFNMSSGVVNTMGVNTYASGLVSGVIVVGGFAGQNDGSITGVTASGAVSGAGDVGGLVGLNYGSTDGGVTSTAVISASSASGSVTGNYAYIGGLVGQNYGLVSGSTATGAVTGGSLVGGLVGLNMTSGVINKNGSVISAARGAVTGVNIVGGLVGQNDGAIVSASAFGPVQGTMDVGGLVGLNYGLQGGATTSTATITASSGENTVSASADIVGGLVGQNYGLIFGSVTNQTRVYGNSDVGGLVGLNMPTGIIQSTRVSLQYNFYNVLGYDNVGGLVGLNEGSIIGSTVPGGTGLVDGNNAVGQLVGYNFGSFQGDKFIPATITNSTTTGGGKVYVDGLYGGGLVGENSGNIIGGSASASAGSVRNLYSASGSFVGYNTTTGSIVAQGATASNAVSLNQGSVSEPPPGP